MAVRRYNAFTLIELILVVGIIAVLAGLVLSTVGYARKKGARARAETEIAAMSAACENYKADNGVYPSNSTTQMHLNAQTSLRIQATYQRSQPLTLQRVIRRQLQATVTPDHRSEIVYCVQAEYAHSRPTKREHVTVIQIHLETATATTIDNPVANPSPTLGTTPHSISGARLAGPRPAER